MALDRASVWRAPALRRSGLVLAVLPGIAAFVAQLTWDSLVFLPPMVAAGAGLLFGVNLLSLDGAGATWLATLPHDPSLVLQAKLLVLAETVGGAVLLSVLAGSLRSPGGPSLTAFLALVTGTVASCAYVVAAGTAMSVRHPHRADLRGPRDAIAPPGALVAASIRLSLPVGALGLLLTAATMADAWWLPPVLGLLVLGVSARILRRAVLHWRSPWVRARVVLTVSAG